MIPSMPKQMNPAFTAPALADSNALLHSTVLPEKKLYDIPDHPNILNYRKGVPTPRPPTRPLTLLLGAGDMSHQGRTNVEQFYDYDMLICMPCDDNGSFQANIAKLSLTPGEGPTLCLMDVNCESQVATFVEHFKGQFSKIEGHWAHIPHFTLDTLSSLLQEKGTASNIFELSCNLINVNTYIRWLEEEYLNTFSNVSMCTCKLASNGSSTLNPEDSVLVSSKLKEKILEMMKYTKNIRLSDDILHDLPTFSHSICQTIYASLLYDRIIPLCMLGTIRTHQAHWAMNPTIQLVLEKSSPAFWESQIEEYKERYGVDPNVVRAEDILAAIRRDIDHCQIFPSKAKYATFLKHVRKTILPALSGSLLTGSAENRDPSSP